MASTRRVCLWRQPSTDDGTPGQLEADEGGFRCLTLEKPDLGNAQGRSSIPRGVYRVEMRDHPQHGRCYELLGVPGRSSILIHSANVHEQLLGCIALGRSRATFAKDQLHEGVPSRSMSGVTESRAAVAEFVAYMGGEPFELTIA